jgi:predicted O-methyltransferase YrrM
MTLPTLDEVVRLSGRLVSMPDRRPEWLKGMASASDPQALYYRLFHELMSLHAPLEALEIGTYVGTSAAHLAAANAGGRVITVDHNTAAKACIEALPIRNITPISGDSMVVTASLAKTNTFDLVFVDANHTFNSAYGEYVECRKLVKSGGLMFFDDIELPMATREMHVFWEFVRDPKAKLPGLHHTGFGVACVDHSIQVPEWKDVIAAATSSFAR